MVFYQRVLLVELVNLTWIDQLTWPIRPVDSNIEDNLIRPIEYVRKIWFDAAC